MNHRRQLRTSILMLGLIIIVGVVGFKLIEGYNFLDALYMTVITMATVGFKEVHELSDGGKIFTIFLIISSFGIFAYSVSNIAIFAVENIFGDFLKKNKIKRMIQKLENHTIVCGFGRNGKEAAITLFSSKEKFVIVEKTESELLNLNENYKYPYVTGDATNEDVLIKAGIENAKAIITTLPIDADNLFVSLTAKVLNKKIKVISRASEEHNDLKLKRAGADIVIMPDKIGGQRMAKLVTEPDTIEFLENIIFQSGHNIKLSEVSCESQKISDLNQTIAQMDVRNTIGINIVGVKLANGTYVFNPTPDFVLKHKDKLFVLGTVEQIEDFKKFIKQLL